MALKQEIANYIHTDVLNIINYSEKSYIINGCEITENTPQNLSVKIASGYYIINGIKVKTDGCELHITNSPNNRYKYGIVRLNVNGEIDIVYGMEEMSNGIKPNRPLNVPDYDPDNYLAIARILIGDTNEILQHNIKDLRIFGRDVGNKYLPGDIKVMNKEIEEENWDLVYTEEANETTLYYYFNYEFKDPVVVDEFTVEGGENRTVGAMWDITNMTYKTSSGEFSDRGGLYITDSGEKLFTINNSGRYYGNHVYYYNLSTAWDISTISYGNKYFKPSVGDYADSIWFRPDGKKMYINSFSNSAIYQYSLSTAWDLSIVSLDKSYSVSSYESKPTQTFFKPDGTSFFINGRDSQKLYKFNLSTAWDIGTASYSGTFTLKSGTKLVYGMYFSSDGKKFFTLDSTTKLLNQYSLSVAWDISTMVYDNISITTTYNHPVSLFFNKFGTNMYYGSSGYGIIQYSLGGSALNYNEENGYYYCLEQSGSYIESTLQSIILEMEQEYNYVILKTDLYEPLEEGAVLTYNISVDGGSTWSEEAECGFYISKLDLNDTGLLVIKLNFKTDGTKTPKVKGWKVALI